jgi:hypothetical protein
MEQSEFITIKLPRISYFASLGKVDPYEKLYKWTAKKAFYNSLSNILFDSKQHILYILSKEYGMSVSDFWICEEDDKKFDDLILKWAIKHHKKTKAAAKRALVMFKFDRGPATFRDDRPAWVQPGYIYVRKLNE